jgi:hypothetical protein
MERVKELAPLFTFVFGSSESTHMRTVRLVDTSMAIDYARGKLMDGHRDKGWTAATVAAGVGVSAKSISEWHRSDDGALTWTPHGYQWRTYASI